MKNKIILFIFIFLFIALPTSGCNEKNIESSQKKHTENKPPPTDFSKAYSTILDNYYDLIVYGSQTDKVNEGELGILEVLSTEGTNATLEMIGYTIQDISGDGIPELMIGAISENINSKFYGNIIYAAYTYTDKTPLFIFEGSARNSYRYLGRQNFLHQGSSGALYSIFGTYTLSPDGKALTCKDYYFTHEKEDNFEEIGFYHNTSGEWDPSVSKELPRTDQEFWQIESDLQELIENLELTPLSKYKTRDITIDDNGTSIQAYWAEDVLHSYPEYEEFFADEDDSRESVIFITQEAVKDFKVLSLTLENIEEDGNTAFSSAELYHLDILTPESPLLVHMTFYGTIPNYGISFTDQHDVVRNFAVVQSGKDGSVILSEFQPQ